MKKIIATVLVAVMALVMFSVAVSAENTLVIDFNTPEGQAAGTFFGNNCNYAEDAGTEGKNVARLVNLAPDGSDASAESEGGLFGNGIAVKFDAGADGEATIVLTLICPDHVNGAFNYRFYHSTNDADYVKEELDAVQDHVFFDYTIKVNVKKGENTIKFVQGVSPWGNGEGGNGWRVDIAKLVITLPGDSAPVDDPQPATQPETQPETQPQTGDAVVAMIAVIAVLAMGAAVVFSKKRAF